MTQSKRTFTSLVRKPYQDAIAVVLHIMDYHMEMYHRSDDEKEFHAKQVRRLKSWLVDMKEYIHNEEAKYNANPTATGSTKIPTKDN